MKFLAITNPAEEQKIKDELKSAERIDNVYLGESFLFYKKGLSKYFYIKYDDIYRAFRRVKSVPMKLCCGRGELLLHYLVLSSNKAEIVEFDISTEAAAIKLLEVIPEKASHIKIGKKK
ncbi:MAG: hypothetical protein MJ160_04560 [Treponema sp.]|nr:hypothetical protein [Treponema sp.]